MKTILTSMILFLFLSGSAFGLTLNEINIKHSTPDPVILNLYVENQNPTVFKLPKFALAGTRPLQKTDRIIGAVSYTASGKNLFERIIELHEKVYMEKKWNPRQMRLLCIVANKNKVFSTSGSVSINNTTSDSSTVSQLLQGGQKYSSQSLSTAGSLMPSFSQSWTSQSFTLWFFLVEEEPPKEVESSGK